MELSERKKQILCLVVEQYILYAVPVGSKVLAQTGLNISPATIRNELNDLENMGYLEQPHISAGRVPTSRGYRFYLDSLVSRYSLSELEQQKIDEKLLFHQGSLNTVMENAGSTLSQLTSCAAISTAPLSSDVTVTAIELMPVSRRTIAVLLIISSGMVKSRLSVCESDLTPEKINEFCKIVNAAFKGKKINILSEEDLSLLALTSGNSALLFSPLFESLALLLKEVQSHEIYLRGENFLLQKLEPQKAVELLSLLHTEEAMERIISSLCPTTCVLLGEETGIKPLADMSIILSPYKIHGEIAGAIGLISPARIRYAWALAIMEYFSDKIGRMLELLYGD